SVPGERRAASVSRITWAAGAWAALKKTSARSTGPSPSAPSACAAASSAATALRASRELAEAQYMVAARPWEVVTESKVRGPGGQVKMGPTRWTCPGARSPTCLGVRSLRLLPDDQHPECPRHEAGPRMRAIGRGLRRGTVVRGGRVDRPAALVERHGAGAALGLHRAGLRVTVGSVFVNDRHRALAVRGEDQLAPGVEGRGVDAVADREHRDDLALVRVEYDQLLIGTG